MITRTNSDRVTNQISRFLRVFRIRREKSTQAFFHAIQKIFSANFSDLEILHHQSDVRKEGENRDRRHGAGSV